MANIPQLQAFQNQVPFAVPNQMPGFTPQNSQGLGMPGGQAMFNLPRFQMPGTDVNFSGTQPSGMSFSITRQASSDPIANIIGDIQNPLGGSAINIGGPSGAAMPGLPQAPGSNLKQKMTTPTLAAGAPGSYGAGNSMPANASWSGGGLLDRPEQAAASLQKLGYSPEPPVPFGLRGLMLSKPQGTPLVPNVFF